MLSVVSQPCLESFALHIVLRLSTKIQYGVFHFPHHYALLLFLIAYFFQVAR